MKHVLVPLLTSADVAAIPTVVSYLKSVSPLAVVIVNNPSLGISAENATAEVDKQIKDLESAENAAVARKDYPAAAQFQQKIEDAKMKRQDVLREGWKKVSESHRFDAYDKLVAPFSVLDPSHVRYIPLTEDITYDTLLVTLANMGTLWPDCLPKEEFALVTPRSIAVKTQAPVAVATSEPERRVETAPKPHKVEKVVPEDPKEARRLALKPHFTLMKVAKIHGFNIEEYKGRSPELVELILAKEFPAAA